ncbi:kallistatin isoform X2 [Echinops telfairi]|uniref:Kallistatin isoform X2 n=1 Tax=Echinops telfairi TaxID=9371 RepID=A0AC55CW90_ECHTE|nr:kallistatin isoform X2 [Echinops telfairi]
MPRMTFESRCRSILRGLGEAGPRAEKMQLAVRLLLLLATLLALSRGQPHPEHPESSGTNSSHEKVPGTGDGSTHPSIVASNTGFALRFYQLMAAEFPGKNIFFSPLSISTSLVMLALGAQAQTQRQIFQGLGLNLTEMPEAEIHSSFQHLMNTVNLAKEKMEAHVGNALFLQERMSLLPKFQNDTRAFYQAQLFLTNFQDSVGATQLINEHVKKETRGMISDLVSELSTDTVMVLVNFIYFKALWEKPFPAYRTRPQDFYVDEQTTVTVPMMVQSEHHHWYLHDRHLPCSVLRMDYEGDASAFFILPDFGAMQLVEEALTPELLARWNNLLSKRGYFYKKVELRLPKFSISGSYELDQLLPKLGFTDLFSERANFSGITNMLNLKMSKSFHKATLDVDEVGTKAAAGSAGSFALKSAPMKPLVLSFNRPFLLVVFLDTTQDILFWGRVANPTEP